MATDDDRFKELDEEIKLGIAELQEYVADLGQKNPVRSVQTAAQNCLQELDRNVCLLS